MNRRAFITLIAGAAAAWPLAARAQQNERIRRVGVVMVTKETDPETSLRAMAFRQALANVTAVLRAGGGTPRDLVKVTFYVRDKRDYRERAAAIGQVYRDLLGGHYPATTLVEVSALWDDEALVEIDATAVLD